SEGTGLHHYRGLLSKWSNPDESARALAFLRRSHRLTVQSRHASEDSRRIAPVFLYLRAIDRADFRASLYLLRRASRAYLVRCHRRGGSGARLLEERASLELG